MVMKTETKIAIIEAPADQDSNLKICVATYNAYICSQSSTCNRKWHTYNFQKQLNCTCFVQMASSAD